MVELNIKTEPARVSGRPVPPGPCSVVIFGVSGDLAKRKLLPALCALANDRLLPEQFALLGFGRSEIDAAELARSVSGDSAGRLLRQEGARPDDATVARLVSGMRYVRGGYGDPESFLRLKAELAQADKEHGTQGNRLFYFAVPPSAFPTILDSLDKAGLIRDPADNAWSRLVVEKPFGRDLRDARALNQRMRSVLDESQIYRIDHYLGKETVQNLLVFRFANGIFEPLWNRKHIDHIQVTFAESIGVEGRGRFYEETGVMRDIVQNHLLQVLTLVGMEPPVTGDADSIRDQKVLVARSLRPISRQGVESDVVFGQYEGYRSERGVASDSVTPTFAAMRVFLDNWRWQGVPIYLRAGKALRRRMTEVAIQFQSIPVCVFGREQCERVAPNLLVIRIQPEEGIALRFALKQPGEPPNIVPANLDFRYRDAFGDSTPDAYVRLLLDAMRGDQTLFIRSDEVEACWAFADPILKAFEERPPSSLPAYAPGSWGPPCADALIERDDRRWTVSA